MSRLYDFAEFISVHSGLSTRCGRNLRPPQKTFNMIKKDLSVREITSSNDSI